MGGTGTNCAGAIFKKSSKTSALTTGPQTILVQDTGTRTANPWMRALRGKSHSPDVTVRAVEAAAGQYIII